MVFACQSDSYLKEFSTVVVNCKESTQKIAQNGKTEQLKGYEVILEDTILFPEGGGQPDDRGTINDVPVLKVFRRGGDAVHFVEVPFAIGAKVEIVIDWTRRFDHMQQHSGQHLITALADTMYGMKTTSWNLGDKNSFIELDTSSISKDQLEELELKTNEKIRQNLTVTVKVFTKDCEDLRDVRSRGLPDDHVGSVRVVSLEGLDENMCCGTHVSNLSHLQMVKLIYVEKGRKNKCNVFFLVGNRILQYVDECIQKDKMLTTFLNGGSNDHIKLVEKMQKSLKLLQKNEVSIMKDLALLESQQFKKIDPRPKLFSLHRKEGNSDFMNIIIKDIDDESVFIFLTVGEENGSGQLVISGNPTLVADFGPKVLEILKGKGSGKGSRFNGKVTDLSKRGQAEIFLKTALGIYE